MFGVCVVICLKNSMNNSCTCMTAFAIQAHSQSPIISIDYFGSFLALINFVILNLCKTFPHGWMIGFLVLIQIIWMVD